MAKQQWLFDLPRDRWLHQNAIDTAHLGMQCTSNQLGHAFYANNLANMEGSKWRNLRLKPFSPHKTICLANMLSMDMQIASNQAQNFNFDPINGRWTWPPPGYYKMNVYGGLLNGCGTFGGLLRDVGGAWVWGFAEKCAAHDPLEMELRALQRGLRTLVDKNLSRMIVESDSSHVINLIHGFPYETHPHLHLILECKRLHTLLWSSSIIYVPRNVCP